MATARCPHVRLDLERDQDSHLTGRFHCRDCGAVVQAGAVREDADIDFTAHPRQSDDPRAD